MLQRVEAEIGKVRRFGMAENAEHATVVVEVVVENSNPLLQDVTFTA